MKAPGPRLLSKGSLEAVTTRFRRDLPHPPHAAYERRLIFDHLIEPSALYLY